MNKKIHLVEESNVFFICESITQNLLYSYVHCTWTKRTGKRFNTFSQTIHLLADYIEQLLLDL